MNIETHQNHQLNRAIAAAVTAMQHRAGGGPSGTFATTTSPSPSQLDTVRQRIKESLRDRVAPRVYERVVETARASVREIVRDRLASELRAALLSALTDRGFDFARVEQRVTERTTDAITERVVACVNERAGEPMRERFSELVRDAIAGTPFADDGERWTTRLRDRVEPELTWKLAEGLRERVRETVREAVQACVRERFADAFRAAIEQQTGAQLDPEVVVAFVRDRLADAIEQRTSENLQTRMRDWIFQRFDQAMRFHVDEALFASPTWTWTGTTTPWTGATTPSTTWPLARWADTLRDQLHASVYERVGEAIRESFTRTMRGQLDDILGECVGPAVCASIAEHKLVGGGNGGAFDVDQLADSVRFRIARAIHDRVIDGVRQTLREIERVQLRDAVWSTIGQWHGGGAWQAWQGREGSGSTNGMH